MSSIVSTPEQVRLIEKWRLRHADPDAVSMWAISTAPKAHGFAFSAIAQDPRILYRAERPQAIRMAIQAEEFALSVAQSNAANNDTWLATAQFVQNTIDAWRQSFGTNNRRRDTGGMSFAPTITRTQARDPWETARRNFPHIDDDTGRLVTRILREFGGAVLASARKPWDHVIALGVLRHAARLLRGEQPERGSDISRESSVADILTVQSYAEKHRLSPMLVPYCGPGRPAYQALTLLRDARTLRDAVRAAADGGEGRVQIWQRAIDLHAFAVVALDRRMMLDLAIDEAYEVAAAAIRQAEAAKQSPDSVEMPLLPPGSAAAPELVVVYARVCLPRDEAGGIQ